MIAQFCFEFWDRSQGIKVAKMKPDARNMNDQPDRFELFTLEEGEEKYAAPHLIMLFIPLSYAAA